MNKDYYIYLIGRIYKILPIYESDKNSFEKYVSSMYIELCGNEDFHEIHQVKNKINGLSKETLEHNIVRKTVFECIDIIDRILSRWDTLNDR